MHTLLATGDPVLISFAEALLGEAGIPLFVADQNIAMTEGSIGAFPRRIMVAADDIVRARQVLTDAGLAAELPELPGLPDHRGAPARGSDPRGNDPQGNDP